MFFDEGFVCFHFRRIEQVDFSNLGNEIGAKFDGVVVGTMRGELVMGFLREDVCEVFTPIRYDWFNRTSSLGNLGRDSRFMDLFSVQPGLLFVQPIGDLSISI